MTRTIAAFALVVLAGCAGAPRAPDAAARAELAPTGKLRAGMNTGNTLFTQRDPATGELRGVSVDLMRELASRLGVPLELVIHATPGQVADDAQKNTWDVTILAIEPARAKTIAFSPAITEIDATYMVRRDSPLRAVEQVDAPGVRIAAAAKAGYELYLTRTLKSATLVRTQGLQASLDALGRREADAVAALKPNLLTALPKLQDARLLDGRFMAVNHGLGTPAGKRAAAAYVKAFVEDLNASGFVARSIERHRVQGLSAVR